MKKIDINGYIGWRTDKSDVKNALAGTQSEDVIEVYLDSFGGYVNDGLAMHDMLHSCSRKNQNIHFYVFNAASIATVIASSARGEGDKVVMSENGKYMIHNVQGGAYGEAKDLEKAADLIRMSENTIARILSRKSGLTEAHVKELMAEETWMTADQAMQLGFIDKVVESIDFNFEDAEDEDDFWNSAEAPDWAGGKKPEKLSMDNYKKISNEKFTYFLNAAGKPKTEPKSDPKPKVNQFNSLKSELSDSFEAFKNEVKEEIKTVLGELASVNSHIEGKTSDQTNKLNSDIEDFKTQISDFENTVLGLNTQLTELTNEKASFVLQVKTLKEELENVKKEKETLQAISDKITNIKDSKGEGHTIDSLLLERNELILKAEKTPPVPALIPTDQMTEEVNHGYKSYKRKQG